MLYFLIHSYVWFRSHFITLITYLIWQLNRSAWIFESRKQSVFGFVFHSTSEKRGKQKHNLKIKVKTISKSSESEGEKGRGWAECASEWKCENAKWLSPRTQINSKGKKQKGILSVMQRKKNKTKQKIPSLGLSVSMSVYFRANWIFTHRYPPQMHTLCVHPMLCMLMDLKSFFCLEWILWQWHIHTHTRRQRLCVKRRATKHTIRSNPDIICSFSTFLVCWQHTETL